MFMISYNRVYSLALITFRLYYKTRDVLLKLDVQSGLKTFFKYITKYGIIGTQEINNINNQAIFYDMRCL